MPAPVALFVYNRPDHTARMLEALAANGLAADTDVTIFCDGAKSASRLYASAPKGLAVSRLVG
jgi:hypothetical protein